MPTSPLPNSAVSLPPLPPPIAVVPLVVELLLPQAARKAATAVELPPTARNLRLDTGFASCFVSAICESPPSRLPNSPYGRDAGGGSKSADGDDCFRPSANPRGDAAGDRLHRLGPEWLGA